MHDYVIVGGGSAGCVLARRLSEDRSVRVLLLEAGGEPEGVADKGHATAPQKHLLERELCWPRGKRLGGSPAMDAMVALRGAPADYDGWAAEHGCAGWRYADVLPYFKRLESNARGASRYHGDRGPLGVADLAAPHRLTQAVVRAALDAGHPYNDDFNAGAQDGAGLHQIMWKGGQRHSAAAAYLQPARGRDNLTVMTGTHVHRIEVEDGRATGVTYEEDGIEWSAEAHEEVILCAGTVASPQLLMRSGIGPAGPLEDRGVAVARDLPGVGKNLQDHLAVAVCHSLTDAAPSRAKADLEAARHLLTGGGLADLNVAEASVFYRTRDGLPAPNVQLYAAPLFFRGHAAGETHHEAFALAPTLLQPESRGHLTLRPDDPAGEPVIQPRYGAACEDLDTLVTALRTAREVFAQHPFARFRAEELLPGPEKASDDALRSYVRLEADTLYHPVGTCAMGTGSGAVVDPALRVRGVEGLRVADASVMPRIPRGNTTLPTIMIAEKAADLIRGRDALPPAEEATRPREAAAP